MNTEREPARATLDEVRRRTTEQRAAAERLLDELRQLESRLAEETSRADAAAARRADAEARLAEARRHEEEERRAVALANERLAERRREREEAETELRAAADAAASVAPDVLESLHRLEGELELRPDAARRAAERRAADVARNGTR